MGSQNTRAVAFPGRGRIFLGATDTLFPGQIIKITGSPTQATVTLTVATVASSAVVLKATDTPATKCVAIAQALAALSSVGAGNVVVLPTGDPWVFTVILTPEVTTSAITVTATFTGGTTPAISVVTTGRSADFTAWTEVGLTSKESPLKLARTGGDTTTEDAWQLAGIASTTDPIGLAAQYTLLQMDVPSLKLYKGANSIVSADGMVQASVNPTPTEGALFIMVWGGAQAFVFGFPRTGTLAADGMDFDTKKLVGLPVASTVLSSATQAYFDATSLMGVAA